MSLKQYEAWIKNPVSREASQPSFFPNGVRRTVNILQDDAKEKSFDKWRSFGARHYAEFKKNPTRKRAIALRNWGFDVKIPGGL
ncbi:MAG: hypothetical protein ACOC2M_00505 [bacterium]